jgi:hypothetical protein
VTETLYESLNASGTLASDLTEMTAVVAAADGTSDERAMIVARAWATAIGPPGPDWLTLVSLVQRYGSAQFFDNRLSHVPLSAAAVRAFRNMSPSSSRAACARE